MLDESEESGGKINWPAAIVVSVVLHVVLFGVFWMLSGPDKKPAAPDSTPDAPVSAPAQGAATEPGDPVPAPDTAPVTPVQPPAPTTTNVRPLATPPVATPPPVTNPPSSAQEETVDYVVKPGDFLSRIAN